MNNHQRVKGHSNLVRDRRTGVILNTNKTEIENAKTRSKIQQERQEHVNSLSAEVNGLKDDISQIKELLFRLLEDKK
jgi:flagellar basal body-associated protein FliL